MMFLDSQQCLKNSIIYISITSWAEFTAVVSQLQAMASMNIKPSLATRYFILLGLIDVVG